MSYWQAIILGIIQGLTEFLPVSSSGHLVVFSKWLETSSDKNIELFFDLAVHVGTVFAILFYYRHSLKNYFQHLFKSLPGLSQPKQLYHDSISIRFTFLAGVAIFATGIIYLIFHNSIEQGFEKPHMVAICWLITAIVLFITDGQKPSHKSVREFSIMAAFLIGLAQGFALFPGISRSGSTICAAILLGLHRRWAGEFSFLIGVPAILGAAVIKCIKMFSDTNAHEIPWGPTLIGMVASAVVGWLALSLLIWAVRKARLRWFAFYCIAIALVTLFVTFQQTITITIFEIKNYLFG